MNQYDLIIIGAGPGGYVAAIRAAQLKAKVLLVDRDEVGGVCLNRGCIPTKAMIASAHALTNVRAAGKYGVNMPDGAATIDMHKVQARKNEIVTQLRTGVSQLLKGHGVEVIKGTASLVGVGKVNVGGTLRHTKNILIATGSTWIDLPGLAIDGEHIVTTDHALAWNDVPKSLLIVGGGVVGCEFACMMRTFGAEVKIIEAMPSILPPVEAAISRLLTRSMKADGIEIITNTTVQHAEISDAKVNASLSNGTTLSVDKVLVSVGRKAMTADLNLSACDIALADRGAIKVDLRFRTTSEGIYAIGDVIGAPMLAHAASAQGIAAVENIFGSGGHYNPNVVPSPIFTSPEIGCVGLTSEELKAKGRDFITGRFPYAACGKALCDGEPEGQAIIHTDMDGKILGAHIIGRNATLIIPEAALAMRKGLSAHELEQTIHAHPTLSEIVAEASADVYGHAIHKLKPVR